MIKGMIILESLGDRSVITKDIFDIEQRYALLMDGITPVEVVIVRVTEQNLLPALVAVAEALLPKRYYAHFVDKDRMYVVYPFTISTVERNSGIGGATCIAIGNYFNVPEHQLPIEKMFSFGHAEYKS